MKQAMRYRDASTMTPDHPSRAAFGTRAPAVAQPLFVAVRIIVLLPSRPATASTLAAPSFATSICNVPAAEPRVPSPPCSTAHLAEALHLNALIALLLPIALLYAIQISEAVATQRRPHRLAQPTPLCSLYFASCIAGRPSLPSPATSPPHYVVLGKSKTAPDHRQRGRRFSETKRLHFDYASTVTGSD